MYKLANVEERNRKHPTTFQIGSALQRSSLLVGDLAKCCFEEEDGGGDRMWLKILEPASPMKYRGELVNEPLLTAGIHQGDIIEFGPENIADVHKESREGLYEPGLQRLVKVKNVRSR